MKKYVLFFAMLLMTSFLHLYDVKSQTVVDIIVNSPEHDTLEAAVIAAGLADDLSGEGPFTVFAPTDAAFKALPAGTLDVLLADPTGLLADLLLYHVASGSVTSGDLSDGQEITTLNGEVVKVTINGEGVFINNAKVTMADIHGSNGVVHVVDAVIVPEVSTVVDLIALSPYHNTLEAAVIAAGLADDLSGEGPFTVFAPTDDAFAALPEGTLDALLEDPTGDLANILLYHVVSGKVMSTDLSDGQTATTLLGKDITVTINGDGVFINDAMVIVADLVADNGVVHVIDAVLLPPAATGLLDITADSKQLSIYPNPATDQVRLSGLNGETRGQLKIINIDGKVMLNRFMNSVSESIDISKLNKGAYYLMLDTDTGRYSGKLLVR